MVRHIRELGLDGVPAYLAWCRENGLMPSLEKTSSERASERDIAASRKANAEQLARVYRNPRKFLMDACAGRIDAATVRRPVWRQAVEMIGKRKRGSEERQSLVTFLLHLERISDLVFETATLGHQSVLYLEGLVRLHERRAQWIRDPLEWRPTSHNTGRQFSSLTRHLLARFDVPAFLDAAWLRGDKGSSSFRNWFVHVGRGLNIRTAKTPYPLTKMIAHHFMNAPRDISIEGALMLADIKALGGGQRLADALMGTRLGQRIERDPERRAFWLSVYRFFIANPMLDLRHAGPIVDFLDFHKFESHEVMVGPGQIEVRPPPQPNLTMTRRTPESLLREVEAWHGALRIARANDKRYWKPSGISGLTVRTGPRDRPEQHIYWTFRELLSGQELIENGRRLRHCVASYAESCVRGYCSIWSLDRRQGDADRSESVLTIEVNSDSMLMQARGLQNRLSSDQEKSLLETWMQRSGLKAGRYLFGW